jgi:DNA-binding response OmpR family regulator
MASHVIVLVEDSPTQAKALALYLGQFGLEVVVADDGPAGITAVAERQPGAVILDVNLPTMSGFQVARHIRRHPATSDIPIIMLTKLVSTSDMVTGLNQGADYYIPKGPDAGEELRRTLAGFGLISWH